MRLVAENSSEMGPNLCWGVTLQLEILGAIACDPQAFKTGTPDIVESQRRAWLAVAQRDRRAEDVALVDRTRAHTWAWWQSFPEQRLLTELYGRAARRQAGSGSRDRRRVPSRDEGLRLARAMLRHLPEVAPLDLEREHTALATAAAAQLLLPFRGPFRPALRYRIRRCEHSRVHFDALSLTYEALANRDAIIPGPLARWHQKVVDGRLQRPPMGPIPRHRPANPDQVQHDICIQFVIEVLRRVGIPPQGTPSGGCDIVAEALEPRLTEATVARIWKARLWGRSYLRIMRKYSKAMAVRAGIHPTKD